MFRDSAKADCGGLLKMLAVKVEVTSASHRKAVVAKQRFDGDRRSLPNPKRSWVIFTAIFEHHKANGFSSCKSHPLCHP